MTYNGCRACVHPDTDRLTAAIVMGESYRVMAAEFGLDKMGVHNHATTHLSGVVQELRQIAERQGQAPMLSRMARLLPTTDPVRVAIIDRCRQQPSFSRR